MAAICCIIKIKDYFGISESGKIMADENAPIFERIRRHYGILSDAKSKVARFILERWDEASFFSAAKIGEAVGVSETVVIRLASELGYSGYPEMQQELQKLAMAILQSTIVKRLDSKSVPKDYDSLLGSSRDRIAKNVDRAFGLNPLQAITDVATELLKAANRYVIGFRASHGPAVCLSVNMNQMIGNTHLISLGLGDPYDRLRNVTARDIAVGITFHKYSIHTKDLLQMVKDKGGKIISITDDLLAPVSQLSDHVLLVDTQGFSFGHSHAGTMALIDILLEAIAFLDRPRVRTNLARTAQILAVYSNKDVDTGGHQVQAGTNKGGGNKVNS
ncbi:MAG TPA: MurR/RpiR family transcriptional regulator [Firmicutes bacterium]|nr:MurR/RpiR family transcriptional regulator [Bacillota bacterium]